MAFNGSREKALLDREIVAMLAEGKKPRQIASELGYDYGTIRRRLSRYVEAIGCATPEQAVALHVAEKIRAVLPLALKGHVDRAVPQIFHGQSQKWAFCGLHCPLGYKPSR